MWPVRLAVLLAVCGAAGCSAPGPATAEVTGTVSLDGKPIDLGVIRFTTAGHEGSPVSATIKVGRYRAAGVPLGTAKVSVSASGSGPGPAAPSDFPTAVELVPAKYNAETTLTADVTAPTTVKDFDLRTQ